MVEHLPRHGIEDPLWNRRRSRDLQKMPAGLIGHCRFPRNAQRMSQQTLAAPHPVATEQRHPFGGILLSAKGAAIGKKTKARQAVCTGIEHIAPAR
jgi:hypothetical protein